LRRVAAGRRESYDLAAEASTSHLTLDTTARHLPAVRQAPSCDDRIPLNSPADGVGRRNAIFSWNGGKRLHDVVGSLSIKWMPIGWSVWWTADRTYQVEGEHFLILNHGRAYTLLREASEPQESFCPFFASSFVEGVHREVVRL